MRNSRGGVVVCGNRCCSRRQGAEGAVEPGSSRRPNDELRDRADWMAKPFRNDSRRGIDAEISKHFSIRPVQAAYLLATIPDGLNNRQNNFRFGAGMVFRLG
jgi:hypothetical protein